MRPPWTLQSSQKRKSQEMKNDTRYLWEGGENSGLKCSRRKENGHLEEQFSIFHRVVRVGFFVNQSLSEDLRGVWECEETSVAGAEWVKRRAAGQGAES